MRGETRASRWRGTSSKFQSAPLMRGETVGDVEHAHRVAISIHSPHTRGDGYSRSRSQSIKDFNPLPSYEGRPSVTMACDRSLAISIHSPHTRGDVSLNITVVDSHLFQSTPLIRGETFAVVTSQSDRLFQSTPLIRGETKRSELASACRRISIHSPHTRGDKALPL